MHSEKVRILKVLFWLLPEENAENHSIYQDSLSKMWLGYSQIQGETYFYFMYFILRMYTIQCEAATLLINDSVSLKMI
jgi:hypothetical protein